MHKKVIFSLSAADQHVAFVGTTKKCGVFPAYLQMRIEKEREWNIDKIVSVPIETHDADSKKELKILKQYLHARIDEFFDVLT